MKHFNAFIEMIHTILFKSEGFRQLPINIQLVDLGQLMVIICQRLALRRGIAY